MHNYLAPLNDPWLELVLVLAGGTIVIAAVGCLAVQFVRSAIWQRTIWQTATLGVLALVLVELSGTGPASVRLWRARTEPPPTRSTVVPPAAGAQPLPVEDAAETSRSVAAATELAWFDETDHGASNDWNGPLHDLIGGVQRENEIQEILPLPIAPGEDPEDGLQSVSERGAGGVFAPSVPIDVAKEAPADEPAAVPDCWWLGAIWALVAVPIVARTACTRALLFAFRRRRTPAGDPILLQRVGTLARRLGIGRPVCVLEASGLRAPVAFGSFCPTVALPATFADDFDPQQQDAVLAHELAHLAARDPAWQLVASLLCAAMWWHPLAWWLRHRLRAASEAAADEASLLVPGGPDLLADCLVAMGRRLVRGRELGWLSVEGPGFRSSLGRRVQRLLNLGVRSWRAPGRGRLILAKTTLPAALVIVSVCCTAWARPQATLTEGETTMNVLRTSWRHSLAAAALTLCVAGCSDAMADDPPIQEPLPAEVADELSDAEAQLVVVAEGKEGEAREREERERDEIEAGEREQLEREKAEAREQYERMRDEAKWRESEAERARLTQELPGLEERAHYIKRFLEALRDDQDAEAREHQAALRGLEKRMDEIRGKLRGGERDRERRKSGREERAELDARLRELTREGRELHGREAVLERDLEGLREGEHVEDIRQLNDMLQEVRAEAERVVAEMHEIMRQRGGREERPRADRPQPERNRLRMHLDELKATIANLKEAGRHEEAAERQLEERDILRQLEQHLEPRRPGPPADDRKRQIDLLEAEIQNMREAAQLAVQMDRMARHPERGDRPTEPPARPPEPRERPPHPELGQRLQQQDLAIHELNAEVKELRLEMAQMREMLKELLGRPRGGR